MGKTLDELLALYTCHKVVKAVKVLEIHDLGADGDSDNLPLVTVVSVDGYRQRLRLPLPADCISKPVFVPGCYYVVYEDGYVSLSPAKAFEEGYALVDQHSASIEVKLDPDDPDPISTVKAIQQSYVNDHSWNAAPEEFWETEKVQHVLTTDLTIKRVVGINEDGYAMVRLDSGKAVATQFKCTLDDCIVYNPQMRVAFVRPASDIGNIYKLNLKCNK
jgi:hypothetical protein